MLYNEDTWSVCHSDVEIDEYLNTAEAEGFSNLSEENLRTLLRSFSEVLRQRKSHLNLVYNLKDFENKDTLVEELRQGIDSLEHDIRCLTSEIEGRHLIKSKKKDEFIFPVIADTDDDTIDLTLLKQLIGPNFDSEDPLQFKSQYVALCHYSKGTPLNERQINQIFCVMLKGEPLRYYTSLHPDLPLKIKIKNLLTVYSYRSSVSDKLRELHEFARRPYEPLDSVFLRLSAILDSTASLIPPGSRNGRSEHILSSAICSLALPAAKHRLAKYRMDRINNGQFLTSKELLKAALRFEEGLPNNNENAVPLAIKDPFINPGESSQEKKIGKKGQPLGQDPIDKDQEDLNHINQNPVTPFWPAQSNPLNSRANDDVQRNIQELSDRIDQLSRMYTDKLNVSENQPTIVESHSVSEQTANKTNDAGLMDQERFGGMLQSFLNAQYNFYRNFDYKNVADQKNKSYLKYQKWGSNYIRELSPEKFDSRYNSRHNGGQYNGGYDRNRQNSSDRPYYQKPFQDFNGLQGRYRGNGVDKGRRYPQPKRVRFSEYIQNRNQNGSNSMEQDPHQNHSQTQTKGVNSFDNSKGRNPNMMINSDYNRGQKRPLEPNEERPPLTMIQDPDKEFPGGAQTTSGNSGFQPMPAINKN